jgi:hypothetical protein
MRSCSPWHLLSSPAGAATALLALGLLAPTVAKAGCSHLVTSRYEAERLASLAGSLVRDLAVPSDPIPARRPCTGAWCTGQPAIPPVPTGTFEGRLGSWAWCPSSPDEVPTDPSFLIAETHVLLPLRRGNEVFHPPRLLASV